MCYSQNFDTVISCILILSISSFVLNTILLSSSLFLNSLEYIFLPLKNIDPVYLKKIFV